SKRQRDAVNRNSGGKGAGAFAFDSQIEFLPREKSRPTGRRDAYFRGQRIGRSGGPDCPKCDDKKRHSQRFDYLVNLARHHFLLCCLKVVLFFALGLVAGAELAPLFREVSSTRRSAETVPSSSARLPISRIPVTSIARAMNGIFLPFAERAMPRTLPTGRSAVPPPDSSA